MYMMYHTNTIRQLERKFTKNISYTQHKPKNQLIIDIN
jgi:hypothetical protein